ncbi:MAG: hypothetical protein J7516_16915, partial [Shinella sp.]|nr:hypothetical protein [Shinella sp.]
AGLPRGGTFVSGSQAAPRPVPPSPQPASEPPPVPAPHLMRTAPDEIAEDLALTGKEGMDDLLSLRRSFARENHPDRAPEDLRANATLRMKIANMLIDETILRLKVEERLGLSR